MILGIGVDLCRVERIRRSVARFGKSWLDEVFTEEEQTRLGAGDEQAHRVAIGFAVKEACAKAIGTGFEDGVLRQDFVVTDVGDHYTVLLTGVGKMIAEQLCPAGTLLRLHVHCRTSESWVNALALLAADDVAQNRFEPLSLFNKWEAHLLFPL